MTTDLEIRGEFLENYRYAHDFWAPFVKDAQVYTLAASGYTWSDEERKILIKEGREPLELNIMRRPLQFFSGYLRDNINEIIYEPIEGSDPKTSDQFTKLSYYIWDKGLGFPVFLDACDEAFKSGIALCGIQMDYTKDFVNGDISFYKRCYNQFYLDPTFTEISLKDCSFAITRDLIDKQYAKQLLPYIDPCEIDQLSMGYRDDKFLQYHPEFTTFSRNRNLIAYDQYYKRVTRKRKFLVDMDSNFYRDITDLPEEQLRRLKIGMKRLRDLRRDADELGIDERDIPSVEIRDVDRSFIELNVLLNGHRMYVGDDKTGINQTYPFVPLICYMEPSIWMPSQRIQGLAACNWSAQRQFNKRHMKIVDMMDSDISTGFKYMIGAVADPSDLQQSGQNKIIGIDPENAPAGMDSVQELRGGGANPALIQYQQVLDQLTLTLSNVTESTLGIDEKGNTQVSGRLAQVRIAQGLRGNRKMFDNVETAQQLLGGLILTAIQENYSPGKVQRIINEEPTNQFYEKEFEQYHATIREGVRSKSQKDAYYYELVTLKRDGIVDVPQSEIIKSISMSGLTDLEKAMQQQDQMMSQRASQALEVDKLKMEVLNATKEEKLGLAQERKSRVASNLSLKDERESEAQQNIAQAALDRARAITEIAQLNEDRIIKVLQFVNHLEKEEAAGREVQKAQVGAQSQQIYENVDNSYQRSELMDQMNENQDQNNIMQHVNQGG